MGTKSQCDCTKENRRVATRATYTGYLGSRPAKILRRCCSAASTSSYASEPAAAAAGAAEAADASTPVFAGL
jgi:hypothetical protein